MTPFRRGPAALCLATLFLCGCGGGGGGAAAPDAAGGPTDPPVLAGLALRLESTAGVSRAGARVSRWTDRSGNGNDLEARGSPSLDPALTPSGRPAIVLDGVADAFERVHATDPILGLPTGNADRTMFVVARYHAASATGGVAYGTAAPNQAFGLGVRNPDGALVLQGFGAGTELESTTPGLGAGWLVQSSVLASGRATLFQDRTPLAQWDHAYDTVLTRLVIGQELAEQGFVAMDVAAVLVYERALAEAELDAVTAYLREAYLAPGGPNAAPTVTIRSPAAPSVEPGAAVRLEATATDAEEGNLGRAIVWTSDRDGELGRGASVTSSTLSLGTHTITASVVDEGGLTAEDSIALAVLPGPGPEVAITGPGVGATIAEGVTVRLAATASDPGDGDLTALVSWSSNLDGPLGTGPRMESAALSVGVHTITAAVTNRAGDTGQASVDLVVSDVALVPTGPIALFDGHSLAGLQPWFATTGFEDPDGVFGVEDGALRVSGQHLGGLATLARYRDYVIVAEFRWGEATWEPRLLNARDAGLLLHGHGAEGEWRGRFLPSIQAQMMEGGTGDVILLEGNTPILATGFSAQVPCTFDTWNCRGGYVWSASGPARDLRAFPDVPTLHWEHWDPDWTDDKGFRGAADLESPVGDWNQLVVEASGDRLDVFLNGVKGNEVVDVFPSSGRIQLESESAEYFVRRLELLPLGTPVGPTIATRSLPSALAGLPYDAPVTAVGGVAPRSWSLASGSLPQGLVLDGARGAIVGQPAASGTSALVLRVTDAQGVAAESPFTLDVLPAVTTLPADGLVLRLEASEFTSAGAVSSWSDQSGMGNHVFAGGGPTVALAATPSGQPAVVLAGLDDTLERVHATHPLHGLPTGNDDRSVFLVARLDGCDASAGLAYGRGATNQAFGLIVRHPAGVLALQGFGNSEDLVSSTPGIGAGWMVQSVVLAGGHAVMFRDGAPSAEWDHVYDTQLVKLALGEEIAGLGHLDAAVAAVLVYDRALDDARRSEVEGFLRAKYLR